MFYYTQIAVHFFNDQLMSFDGVHPTTGFQPLWMLILAPFGGLMAGAPDVTVRIVFGISSLMSMVVGASLIPFVHSLVPHKNARRLAMCSAVIWVLHPKILILEWLGTEASLAALCWIWSLIAWRRVYAANKGYVWLGLFIGIGVLARIDHFSLGAMFGISLLLRYRLAAVKGLAAMSLVVIMVTAPWFLACQHATGSIVPDSGKAKHTQARRIVEDMGEGELGIWLARGRSLRSATWFLIGSRAKVFPVSLILAALAAGLILTRRVRIASLSTVLVLKAMWPLWVSGLLLLPVYLMTIIFVQPWYLMPIVLAQTLFAAGLIVDASNTFESKSRIVAGAWLVVCLSLAQLEYAKPKLRDLAWITGSTRLVQRLVPEGDVVAAFNSGYLGAACWPRNRVVNIDGLVNHSAIRAQQGKNLDRYLLEEKITWIADISSTLTLNQRLNMGSTACFELIDTIDLNRDGLKICLWRVSTCPP